MTHQAVETAGGRRFEFGQNWRQFLDRLDEQRIATAERSLQDMLSVVDLQGISFLDIGSGSGLFSLAARRLGARVHSFDFDRESVACTRVLKDRYFAADTCWTIDTGSVLDADYMRSLGPIDVVYAWGVLHHTGALWQALENATIPLSSGGWLFLAVYNHQLYWTWWRTWLKRAYVATPRPLRWLISGPQIAFQLAKGLVKDLVLLRDPRARYREYSGSRGMSWWHDTLDWIGGYPFETATPEAIFDFFAARGFTLERLQTCGAGHGCNQFVFRKQ